jgi:uncharacterized protein (DUF885 family)
MSLTVAYLLLFVVTNFGQQLKPLAARLADANALYEEQNQSDLRNLPLNATFQGDYRYNDRLTDYSLNGYRQRNEADKAFLARLEAISTQGFSEKDRLSHDLLENILRQRIANYNFKEHEIPLNLDISVHLTLATLAQRVPLDSVKHYEDYISFLLLFSRSPSCFAPESRTRLFLSSSSSRRWQTSARVWSTPTRLFYPQRNIRPPSLLKTRHV